MIFHSALEVEELVLNHVIWVVTEKWFPVQAGNTSVFVEPDFAVDIGSWFCYRDQCIGAFDSDNTFTSMSIAAKSFL